MPRAEWLAFLKKLQQLQQEGRKAEAWEMVDREIKGFEGRRKEGQNSQAKAL